MKPIFVIALAISPVFVAASRAAEYDVVVYGGTSGGVIAAVQAKKMGKSVVVVGPGGLDLSRDGGRSFFHLVDDELWSVAFGPSGVGWAVGAEGRVTRIVVR